MRLSLARLLPTLLVVATAALPLPAGAWPTGEEMAAHASYAETFARDLAKARERLGALCQLGPALQRYQRRAGVDLVPPGGRKALAASLAGRTPVERTAASMLLSELADTAVRDHQLGHLARAAWATRLARVVMPKEQDPDAFAAELEALGKLRDRRVLPTLLTYAVDADMAEVLFQGEPAPQGTSWKVWGSGSFEDEEYNARMSRVGNRALLTLWFGEHPPAAPARSLLRARDDADYPDEDLPQGYAPAQPANAGALFRFSAGKPRDFTAEERRALDAWLGAADLREHQYALAKLAGSVDGVTGGAKALTPWLPGVARYLRDPHATSAYAGQVMQELDMWAGIHHVATREELAPLVAFERDLRGFLDAGMPARHPLHRLVAARLGGWQAGDRLVELEIRTLLCLRRVRAAAR